MAKIRTAASPFACGSCGIVRTLQRRRGPNPSPTTAARRGSSTGRCSSAVRPDPRGERVENLLVERAFEGHDHVRQSLRIDPAPFAKFRVLGGDVDVAVLAQKAAQEPVLLLPDPLAAPEARPPFLRQVVAQPLRARRHPLDEMRRDARLFLKLAKRGRPRLLVLVD